MSEEKNSENLSGEKLKTEVTDPERETMENLLGGYTDCLREVREGKVVTGRVIEKNINSAVVDIGYKSEGLLSLSEFDNPDAVAIGDQVRVLVVLREDEDGMVVLSKRKAERIESWEKILNEHNEGSVIQGTVTRKVKGGLMVNIESIEAFLPASQVAIRGFANLDRLLGQTMPFKIIKINRSRKNVVLSRREYLLQEREENKQRLLAELAVGQARKGTVKNITDFGAFIDVGGIDGLLHITDMSWGRISHPSEMLAVGDVVEVMVLSFDKEKGKISLGLKQRTPNPWQEIENKYPVGSKVKGKVVNIVPYGAFIELEKGVEGLVHISELSWTRRINHPSEVLAMGDIVEAMVLNVNKEQQKLSLGIKQTEANPWLEVGRRYHVDDRIKGKVRHLTDYGVFVELEEGIDGLIHVSDLSWTRRVMHPGDILKKGQKVEVIILAVEPENQRISLGLKQMSADPWEDIVKRYPLGMLVEGKVTKIASFGMFVEIEKELEGLVHISEINLPPQGKLEDHYKVGDPVKAQIIKVDSEQRRIALSMKEVAQNNPVIT